MKKYLLLICAAFFYAGSALAQTDFYSIRVSGDSCTEERTRGVSRVALKTNLVYDAVIVPNMGAEFSIGKGFSIGASAWYTWWETSTYTESSTRFWRSYGGELELRKYLGSANKADVFSGHHVGIMAEGFLYDYNPRGRKGQMSDFTYGVGLEYGYSVRLDRRLNLDMGVAVGYMGGRYKTYQQDKTCFVWENTRQRNYFGPVKAELSLVYLLGKMNNK